MSDLQEITGLFTNEAIQVMAEAYDVALDVSFQKGRSRNTYLVQRQKYIKKKHSFFSEKRYDSFLPLVLRKWWRTGFRNSQSWTGRKANLPPEK